MLKILRLLLRGIMATLTVLVLLTFYLYLLPGLLDTDALQTYPWLAHISVIVVLFWCIRLVGWIIREDVP